MAREFHISEKHTHSWLADKARNFVGSQDLRVISIDLVQNARELVPELDEPTWEELLAVTRHIKSGATGGLLGIDAIAHSLARSIGPIAQNESWSLGDPPVVYISGAFFVTRCVPATVEASTRLGQIKKGLLRYNEPGKTELILAREQRRAALFPEVEQTLEDVLADYAQQFVRPNSESFLVALRAISDALSPNATNKRREALKVLAAVKKTTSGE